MNLIERLRGESERLQPQWLRPDEVPTLPASVIMEEAATQLEAYEAEVERLREALEAIKELADNDDTFLCWKTANDALTSSLSNPQMSK